ncbi:hypothetical protein L596_027822 [Steinernema carpocapsae]|uniref:Uncharacterized protein n=1 Tax=Steinernema carpocapsae TaxID=34508 RepID=A0A4V5ZXP8_STECR|nr:hypothetical protein L596_027822 [Steinernema carpocapsae]
MGSANDIKLQKAPKLRPEEVPSETLECSTLPEGLGVQIRPNGKIRVVEEKTGKGVLYPTTRDEYQKRDDLKPKVNPKWIEKRRKEKQKRKANHQLKRKREEGSEKAATKGKPKFKKAKKEVKAETKVEN